MAANLHRTQGTGLLWQKGPPQIARRQGDSSQAVLEVVFDEPIAIGKYVLAVYTRCGHDANYRVVRVSRKIQSL